MCSAPEECLRERRFYRIGGLPIEVEAPPFRESELLSRFRVRETPDPELRLEIQVAELPQVSSTAFRPDGTLLCFDGQRRCRLCLRERSRELLYRVTDLSEGEIRAEISPFCAENLGTTLVLRFLDLPYHFLARDSLLLHASLIRVGDKALAFTASKGIGKSTQAALWARWRGAEILNGDRALLRLEPQGVRAWSTPYCGTSGICCDESAPLGGIVILKQWPENTVRRALGWETARALLSGINYDREDGAQTERVLELCAELYRRMPFWVLECVPDQSAVDCLDRVLREEGFYVNRTQTFRLSARKGCPCR